VRARGVATAGALQVATLERVRGRGVGKAVMRALVAHASARHPALLPKMGAQTHALRFYASLGWQQYGDEFDDAGIPHYAMVLVPDDEQGRRRLDAVREPGLVPEGERADVCRLLGMACA
jgi:GNAT superfamily N-acetyltransferase